jgi:hypothetical protein
MEERVNYGGKPPTNPRAVDRCTLNIPVHIQGLLHQMADDLDQSKSQTVSQIIEHAAQSMGYRVEHNRSRYVS